VHSITWRVDDQGICREIFSEEILEKNFYLCIYELDIGDTVATSVFLAILTGLRDELDTVDLFETIREEDPKCPCSGIEVEENSSSR